ncbi:MAG TPA: hypothetical protein ACFYD7_08760 [Candidatus Wujingus californicus]|uniref:hypothetical protein n=1 Tax=Candidatus Wujingus californicus TaxID=3367618 RepID=UPI001D8D2E09|nr:hypothetical protein [Planctomycetota bacterium]MDO8094870.1 hypothetical protein [Candidatus Brocadiales bacterium]MDO8130501.1 hypothetical protein [Candidatus Brocadiales bacterium]
MTTSMHTIPLYHQIILAYELTLKRPSNELKKLNQTLKPSAVDRNPHHIDAALFVFNCPLSRGSILLTVTTLQSWFPSLLPFQEGGNKGRKERTI